VQLVTRVSRVGLLVALAAVAAAAACSSSVDGGAQPSGSAGAASSATAAPTGATATPSLPAGWTAAREGELSFALPPGFKVRPPGSGMPGATNQWTKTDDPQLAIPPAVAVFVETGRVGPLDVRTDLVGRARSAELGAEPVGAPREVEVPGSIGAQALEWRWDYAFVTGQPPVPSRQVEVVVQGPGPAQYGLLLGGPATYFTDELMTAFTSSLALLPAGSGV